MSENIDDLQDVDLFQVLPQRDVEVLRRGIVLTLKNKGFWNHKIMLCLHSLEIL